MALYVEVWSSLPASKKNALRGMSNKPLQIKKKIGNGKNEKVSGGSFRRASGPGVGRNVPGVAQLVF